MKAILQLTQLLAITTSSITAFQVVTKPSVRSTNGVSCQASSSSSSSSSIVDRRSFAKVLTAGILASSSVGSSPQSAYADVSDGNSLPEGAAQFSRLIRLKDDLIVSSFYYFFKCLEFFNL